MSSHRALKPTMDLNRMDAATRATSSVFAKCRGGNDYYTAAANEADIHAEEYAKVGRVDLVHTHTVLAAELRARIV